MTATFTHRAETTTRTHRLRLLANETGKGLRLMWRRRSVTVTGIVANAVTYLGVSLFIGGGHFVKPLLMLTLPALLATTVAAGAALQGSGGVAEEIFGGTLEQAQLGPASATLQVLGRMAALAAEVLAAAAVLGIVFLSTLGLHYAIHPGVLVPAVLTVVDALGYALLVAALTVRVVSIGAITHVFNMVIMVFAGMMVPVTIFPHGLHILARFVPTTLGVEAVNSTLTGVPLAAIWSDGVLPWLLLHATVLVTAGLLTYVAGIRRARREGGLSPR
jgi:ABC-2 type transport system permease protein